MNEIEFNQVNSAEMTAYWRTTEPIISKDKLSVCLVSKGGIKNAHNFVEKLNYDCVPRLISLRARYFLDQAICLLNTNKYDSCISFDSGFSMLNNNIFSTRQFDHINFYDTDLPHVVEIRKNRISELMNSSGIELIKNDNTFSFDLNNLINGNAIRDKFPNVLNPIIILEGISYFIHRNVLNSLFKELSLFNQSAIIFDYFPHDSDKRSNHFRMHAKNVTSFIPPIINTISEDNNYSSLLSISNDVSVQEYESQICEMHHLIPQLMDENKFFPTQFITLTK